VFPVRYGLPTVYLCVPYGSHSKQRLFPHTVLTGWALYFRLPPKMSSDTSGGTGTPD
jgi:hypothetical protein